MRDPRGAALLRCTRLTADAAALCYQLTEQRVPAPVVDGRGAAVVVREPTHVSA